MGFLKPIGLFVPDKEDLRWQEAHDVRPWAIERPWLEACIRWLDTITIEDGEDEN